MSVPAPRHHPAAPLAAPQATSTAAPCPSRPVAHSVVISRRLRAAAGTVAPRGNRIVDLGLGLRAVLVFGRPSPTDPVDAVEKTPEDLRRAAVLRARHRRGGRPVAREFLEYVRVPDSEED